MVLVGSFCNTFWPFSEVTEILPITALTHPTGTAPSAYDSKVSFHGSGRTTRALASPVSPANVARITPPCSTGSLAAVNVPSWTVPDSPSSDQAALASRRKRPLSSNSLARRFTLCPGVSTNSVGITWRCVGGPSPLCAGSSAAQPVRDFACREPIAYTASLDTKKMRPREMAAPARICSGVPSDPQQLFVLAGSSTALKISARSGCGRMIKNFPPSVPT